MRLARWPRCARRTLPRLRHPAASRSAKDLLGLTLPAFEDDNQHLLPGYRTLHQKGGYGKAQKARLKEAEAAVAQTQQLLEVHGVQLFAETNVPDERPTRRAQSRHADRHRERAQLRNASEYQGQQDLLRAALARTKRSTPQEIEYVLKYLMNSHRNVSVPKEAAVVLRDWDALERMALPTSRL